MIQLAQYWTCGKSFNSEIFQWVIQLAQYWISFKFEIYQWVIQWISMRTDSFINHTTYGNESILVLRSLVVVLPIGHFRGTHSLQIVQILNFTLIMNFSKNLNEIVMTWPDFTYASLEHCVLIVHLFQIVSFESYLLTTQKRIFLTCIQHTHKKNLTASASPLSHASKSPRYKALIRLPWLFMVFLFIVGDWSVSLLEKKIFSWNYTICNRFDFFNFVLIERETRYQFDFRT